MVKKVVLGLIGVLALVLVSTLFRDKGVFPSAEDVTKIIVLDGDNSIEIVDEIEIKKFMEVFKSFDINESEMSGSSSGELTILNIYLNDELLEYRIVGFRVIYVPDKGKKIELSQDDSRVLRELIKS